MPPKKPVTESKKVGLVPVKITLPKGSPEERLANETELSKSVLVLPHPLFSLRFVDDDLYFDMDPEMSRHLMFADITEDEEDTISYIDLILSPYNNNSFNWVSNMAGQFDLTAYDPNELQFQTGLMCLICWGYFDMKFSRYTKLEDVTRPIPTQLFLKLLNKVKDIEIAYKDDDGYLIAGKLKKVQIISGWFTKYIQAELLMISHTKGGYICMPTSLELPFIANVAKIEDLGFMPVTDGLKAELTERGKKYVQYTKAPSYAYYKGFAFRPGSWFGDVRLSIDGRVMVDIGAMRTLNPAVNDSWYMGNLFDRNAKPAADVDSESLWMCSPVIYGFSFSTKDWCRMSLDDIFPVTFSSSAFEELIVPSDYKNIFVSCLTGSMPSLDSIEGKGNGKIFLLYGPPGCGKTLTAESVAEYLRRPLYYVSVGELGISPKDLEEKLAKIMEVAQNWNAVVLLDEVDVFAAKRTNSDIQRNAMTAILLRLLERYSGVMFMTTNLIDNLDPAFISRATAAIEYKELPTESRKVIWKSLLAKAMALGLVVDGEILLDLNHFADRKLNGREIKNCIRLAYSVAMSTESKKLTMEMLTSIVGLSRSVRQEA